MRSPLVPLPNPPELPSGMYTMPLAMMGLDQWCRPIAPVHSTLPVLGSIACTLCSGRLWVCSPEPLAANRTPLATNADEVQPLKIVHLRTSVGLPAASTVTWKPAMPFSPGTNTHTALVAGSVHTAPWARIMLMFGNGNSCSSPPRLPGPPLPDMSPRFSSRIARSLPGCTPRFGYFFDSVVGRISTPPLPMSRSDLMSAVTLLGV